MSSASASAGAGSSPTLQEHLNRKTFLLGLQLWTVIGIAVGLSIFSVLLLMLACLSLRHRRRHQRHPHPHPQRHRSQIPAVSKEIKEVTSNYLFEPDPDPDPDPEIGDASEPNESETAKLDLGARRSDSCCYALPLTDKNAAPPFTALPGFSDLGWGHWFTLRDLEFATNRFTKDNIIGEGGYGIVYRGQLLNGAPVAVKKLLNNL